MNILTYLPTENIYTDIAVTGKKDFFEKAASCILQRHGDFEKDALIELFLRREETLSTGIGKGFAIPHIFYAKATVQELYVFKPKRPIDFNSIDSLQVSFVFLLIGPAQRNISTHMQILAKIALMLKKESFTGEILSANTPELIHNILEKHG